MAIANHYDVLGVPSDASSATIRNAYRQRARLLHPDRSGDGPVEANAMAAVNEAYRILGEPDRRALYDSSLGEVVPDVDPIDSAAISIDDELDMSAAEELRRRAAMQQQPSRLAPDGPARVPWKLMLVTAVLGSGLVMFAASFNDAPSVEPPDGIIRSGSCVVIETNGDAREGRVHQHLVRHRRESVAADRGDVSSRDGASPRSARARHRLHPFRLMDET